jgi:hypothetical protein
MSFSQTCELPQNFIGQSVGRQAPFTQAEPAAHVLSTQSSAMQVPAEQTWPRPQGFPLQALSKQLPARHRPPLHSASEEQPTAGGFDVQATMKDAVNPRAKASARVMVGMQATTSASVAGRARGPSRYEAPAPSGAAIEDLPLRIVLGPPSE